MSMLLHVCCGPCATGAVPFWERRGTEVIGFFFNPNIHPFFEHRRRLTSTREAAEHAHLRLEVDDSYDPEAWFAAVASGEGSRCERCIGMRLRRAGEKAVALGCEAFSTSLSISPWQDHEAIRVQGEKAGRALGITFMYEDLRPQYAESRNASRKLGLYTQKYCGCLMSEQERYGGRS